MKPLALFVFLILFSVGCTSTVNRAAHMRPGMTRAEVITTLGEPDQTMSPNPETEILGYKLTKQRLYRLAVPLTTEYLVQVEHGNVIAYGPAKDFHRFNQKPPIVVAAPKNEKTININVRTEGNTNAVAPIQPRLDLDEK